MKQMVLMMLVPIFCIAAAKEETEKVVQQQTPYQIMKAVDQSPDGETRSSEMKMILTNKRGRTRERTILSYSKDYGNDSKGLMFFKTPADVRGTAFLMFEYEDSSKEDDRWLYLPAMRKVRRISGSSKNDYFMGSDFTYDDMGDRDIDQYSYKLLKEEHCGTKKCWVIEALPKKSDDAYSKMIYWVRQDAYKIIKCDYYDRDKRLLKTFTIKTLKKHEGFWTAFEMEMVNLQKKHKTTLQFKDVRYNKKISDSVFNVSTLRRGRVR